MGGRRNRKHASGRFNGTDAGGFADPGSVLSPAAGNQRRWTVERTALGRYTITLQVGLGLGEREINLGSRTADVKTFIDGANETATTIPLISRTTAAAPADADCDIDFEVVRTGG